MRLVRGETGLWHGFWFTLAGKRLERVSRSELGEAYRLYRIGTSYGLTDRAANGAGHQQPPSRAGVVTAPSRGWQSETNPFHDEEAT